MQAFAKFSGCVCASVRACGDYFVPNNKLSFPLVIRTRDPSVSHNCADVKNPLRNGRADGNVTCPRDEAAAAAVAVASLGHSPPLLLLLLSCAASAVGAGAGVVEDEEEDGK